MTATTSSKSAVALRALNDGTRDGFVRACGPLFEHSPWVAERAWASRPFATRDALLAALVATMYGASAEEQFRLIASHPDLVGRLARARRLTADSAAEQSAAGLSTLSPAEAEAFDRYNAAYKAKFGFPFVICARENKKDAILAAFPHRLANGREAEVQAALAEIAKIARLRLFDAVGEA